MFRSSLTFEYLINNTIKSFTNHLKKTNDHNFTNNFLLGISHYTQSRIMTSQTVLSVLSKSQKSILISFKSMYEFVNRHKGNKKVSKKDLMDLLGNNLKTIIKEIKILKPIDDKNDNKNVNTIVNKVLKDFFDEFSPNDDTNQVNNESEERNEDIEVLSQ